MNSNELTGQWQKLKGEIRSRWGKLTDDDIERIAGNKDRLIGALQERYGYVWDEARQTVDRYLEDYDGLKSQAREALRNVASKENLQKFGNDATELIRRYPVSSLLIGLGIGYLLARLNER
ncbi:MAG TPA: CsbD family protein [Candidatus Binatia bacterium]|nr:CsbD family protein [Candidatus Binatia bacterium]